MGKTLATTISGNLLVRASLLTVLIVGFLGVASGVLPVGCLVTGSCKAPPTPADTAVAKLLPQMAQQNVTVAKPVVQKTAPSLTHNDVLAATFAQLKVDLAPPTATGSSSGSETQVAMATPDKAVPAAKTTVNPDSGLTTRKVKALTVKADGTPDLTGIAQAYAETSRPVAPPSPAVEAAARIGAGLAPVAEQAEAKVAEATPDVPKTPAADSKASGGNGSATVLGAGANVRAAPSKGGKVLFALNGGERVTVIESKRGWFRVKDDQGRSGWIYADGVKRG